MAEEIYEEIMAKHFTKWIKDVNSQIQETLKIPAVKKKKKKNLGSLQHHC